MMNSASSSVIFVHYTMSKHEYLKYTCFMFSVGKKKFQFILNRIQAPKHHKKKYLFLLRVDSIALFINAGIHRN